jgi:hypothetical protein
MTAMTNRKKVVAAFVLLFMLVLTMAIMTMAADGLAMRRLLVGSCVSTLCAGSCDYPLCQYVCADECGVVSP